MTNPNDPAFIDAMGEGFKNGLTKREYFAAMAMTGISIWDAKVNDPINTGKIEELARACVAYADACIAELNKSEPKP